MKKFNLACIIEDNLASIFWMKELMEEVGFAEKILTYKNGKEALDQLSLLITQGSTVPEIIFLDLNMPVMDGWDFLDAFTNINPPKKIIIYILTSSVDPADTKRADKYEQLNGYLIKPITEQSLRDILRVTV